jgi:Cbb3-type cytochrome oxidase, subunit 1
MHNERVMVQSVWHSLLWLAIANLVGVLLALLLLLPSMNSLLGEWTYGRWVMVHMNLELYGWTSIPLVGYLFHVYGVGYGTASKWSRPILWAWSTALAVGVISWLTGHSTGKLFLDWQGFAQSLFIVTLISLWLLLVCAFCLDWMAKEKGIGLANTVKIAGLLVLMVVPAVMLAASNPNSYPPINPSTGGPTGSSQLESSLGIVLITILLPLGIAQKKSGKARLIGLSWLVLSVHACLCVALGRTDSSHREPAQYIGLATIVLWLLLVPAYYRAFEWHAGTRLWRSAVLWWWAALLVTGPVMFLPGILDHFKFTDGLVGHSFVAMAGFASSLVVLVMVQLLGDDAWIFNRRRTFYMWHMAIAAYVIDMTIAGWREGFAPSFTIVPGHERNLLYVLRLVVGIAMLFASVEWLVDCNRLLRAPQPALEQLAMQRSA